MAGDIVNGAWPAICALTLLTTFWVGWQLAVWHHKIEVTPVVWPWRAYKGTHTQTNPQPPETPVNPDEYGRHAQPLEAAR